MDNENSHDHTDLNDSLVINETRILSSTRVDDTSDQSVIEVNQETPIIEVQDTTTSFVVEDTGVIHIKTEKISNVVKIEPANGMELQDGEDKKSSMDNADFSKDVKKEDSVFRKNDATEVYLQLDVTDTLDKYLERERIRKLKLSKAVDKGGTSGQIPKKTDTGNEGSVTESETDTSLNETVVAKKVSLKRTLKDSSKKNDLLSCKDENVKGINHAEEMNEHVIKIETPSPNLESKASAASKLDVAQPIKTEPSDNDKKDSSRFLWISNVNKTTKATDLKMHLATFGKILLAKIVTDGKQCFGYVTMESSEDVARCIENLQNSIFEGKQITLSDKAPERRRSEKSKEVEALKQNELKKSETKSKDSESSEQKDVKMTRPDYKDSPSSDPLTLKVSHSSDKRYSEERRRLEALERKRFHRERLSAERRDYERKRRELEREKERERERERQREREKELRKREIERQKVIEVKLEKERRKLDYERKMIEKEKMELLRYKRKLLNKEKESDGSREDHKRRGSPDKYDRKKYAKLEEHGTKHSSVDVSKQYWKGDDMKPIPHDIYKKSNQDICVPPPPILSTNYHSVSERPRSTDREKQWYDRKEYDNRPKSFVKKLEDGRSYAGSNNGRQPYPERAYPKEQYKHKDYSVIQPHNSWNGYSEPSYKEQNIPVLRSEIPRTMHPARHQTFHEGSYGAPPEEYYAGSGYRRVNDYYNRPTERKY